MHRTPNQLALGKLWDWHVGRVRQGRVVQKYLAKPGSARFPRWRMNPSGPQHRRPGEPYSALREMLVFHWFYKGIFQVTLRVTLKPIIFARIFKVFRISLNSL